MNESENNKENLSDPKLKELEDGFYSKIKILQDPVTFKVFLFLLAYNELSLADLSEKVGKSKPTIFRHIRKLVEANFAYESQEVYMKSPIPTKFYRPKIDNFKPSSSISKEDIHSMSIEQKIRFYQEICQTTNVTINFVKSALDEMQIYLEKKTPIEIQSYVMEPDIVLGLNMMSEKAYHRWLEIYQKAMMEFYQSMQEELLNPNTEKPYALMMGILPIKKIYENCKKPPEEDINE